MIKKIMDLKNFIKKRQWLAWYVKDLSKLSEKSILEHTLNYGDFKDVLWLFKILGIKKAAKIFYETCKEKICNYTPQIKNYFKLYFEKYA